MSPDWPRNEENETVRLIFHLFVKNVTQPDGSRLSHLLHGPKKAFGLNLNI